MLMMVAFKLTLITPSKVRRHGSIANIANVKLVKAVAVKLKVINANNNNNTNQVSQNDNNHVIISDYGTTLS